MVVYRLKEGVLQIHLIDSRRSLKSGDLCTLNRIIYKDCMSGTLENQVDYTPAIVLILLLRLL